MVRTSILAATGIALSLGAWAQDVERRLHFGLEYDTELQTDFRKAKWVNLLRMDLRAKLTNSLSLNVATLSTAQTNEQPLIDDLQGFSNIEAENIPLTLAVLSLDWETEHTTLSVGIRNFNEHYFATDLTSFFTQSSHGIFPAISANFPIANFPVASLGVDFQWRIKQFTLDASIYNGVGYKNFVGRENLFRFCPNSDGVFGALQLSHNAPRRNTHIGVALHSRNNTTRTAIWAYTELNLAASTQLLAQYSLAPRGIECSQHASLGLKQTFRKVEVGLAQNFARFAQADEWATELTARVSVMKHLTLQPVIHLCHTGSHTHCVALLRLTCSL